MKTPRDPFDGVLGAGRGLGLPAPPRPRDDRELLIAAVRSSSVEVLDWEVPRGFRCILRSGAFQPDPGVRRQVLVGALYALSGWRFVALVRDRTPTGPHTSRITWEDEDSLDAVLARANERLPGALARMTRAHIAAALR